MKTRSKKRRHGQYTELSSSDGNGEEPSSSTPQGDLCNRQPETPKKKADAITTIQKIKLQRLGCLITCEKNPRITIQVCHIIRRKIYDEELEVLEKMWHVESFNIDSTSNLVALRADLHAAYDAECWTFAPEMEILDKILANMENGTFENPYKQKPQLYKYVFIPLPPLGQKFIHRFDPETSTFTTFSPDTGYANFPILRYHAHPFCTIINALPKLKKYRNLLPQHHRDLLAKMLLIEFSWKQKLESTSELPRSLTRTRDDQDDGDSEDEEDEDSHQDKRRRTDPGKAKAKGQRKKRGDKSAEGPRKSSRRKLALDNLDISNSGYYEQSTNVASWREKLVPMKRPRRIQRKITWAFHEPTRAPFAGDWHEYCKPWNRPSDRSQFSSIDWAMHHYMFPLTRSLKPWDEDDYWGSATESSDSSSCHSFSS